MVELLATGGAQDVRLAIRRVRTPALPVAIVLTIGLGLGGAAAIFTASGAALVAPLPYANPERLVHLWELRAGTEERSPTSVLSTLLDWRAHSSSFAALEGYDPANFTVGVGDDARMLRGALVTDGFFRLLGVRMSAGRDFVQGEDATVATGVAVVTHHFARSVGAGATLGHAIAINDTPYVIVGVLPESFHFALLQDAEVFVPLAADGQRRADRSQRSVHALGRLQDQVPLVSHATDELATVMAELARDHPDALAGRRGQCRAAARRASRRHTAGSREPCRCGGTPNRDHQGEFGAPDVE